MAKISTTCEQSSDLFNLPKSEIEIWKDIPGLEGFYMASNLGRIKSVDRIVKIKSGSDLHLKGKLRKPFHGNYLSVKLWKNGIRIISLSLVHRVIALTFVPNQENKIYVNHKDGNKFKVTIYLTNPNY